MVLKEEEMNVFVFVTYLFPDHLESLKEKKVVKRVPKGTSEYQAAWIINSDDESDDEDDECEDDDDDYDNELRKEIAQNIDSDQSMVNTTNIPRFYYGREHLQELIFHLILSVSCVESLKSFSLH